MEELVNLAKSWLTEDYDEETRAGAQQLLDGEPTLLEDAFYKNMEFGTGGMRGIMGVGTNRINKYTLGAATQGLSNYIKQQFPDEDASVAIAFDCRHNSDKFARIVADIFTANGIRVNLFESLRPTPELSFAVRHLGCKAGIVLTASHNPPEYNGYKVYWEDGAQIVAPHDANIIAEVGKVDGPTKINFNGNDELLTILGDEIDQEFIRQSVSHCFGKAGKSDLKIVFTSLHGTSIKLLPQTLAAAGFSDVNIVEAQAEPNGDFPTVESPNPEEPAALKMAIEMAKEIDADIVIGTDPDSDRLGIAVPNLDGEFEILSGNQTGVLLTDYLLCNQTNLDNTFIAYTIVSSELFGDVAKRYGTDSEVCLTGFKHIAKLIKENEDKRKFLGGGEESFGYMIGDFVRDKDAVTSTLMACEMAAEAKAGGGSLFQQMVDVYKQTAIYREALIALKKTGKSGAEEIAKMMEGFRNSPPADLDGSELVELWDLNAQTITDLKTGHACSSNLPKSNVLVYLAADGTKVCIRPSGTEPKIKFYFSMNAKYQEAQSFQEQWASLGERLKRLEQAFG